MSHNRFRNLLAASALSLGLLTAGVGIAGASSAQVTTADTYLTVTPAALATSTSAVDQLLAAHGINPTAFAATFPGRDGVRINAAGVQLFSTHHGHVLANLTWAQVAQAVTAALP